MPNASPSPAAVITERPPMGDRLGWLIPVVVWCVIGLGYFFFLRPQFFTLRDLRSRHALATEGDALERQIRELRKVAEVASGELADARSVVDAAIPGTDDIPGLIVIVESAAQRAGVSVTGIEVSREPAPASLSMLAGNDVLVVGMSVQRVEYTRLKTFLEVLASSARLMDVLSVQFSPKALTATIRARTYMLR
ncbi:hypothetical protein HY632_02970 [Candidatus Uhrbacteria bacterium]|nr:hypothetical protein [Candidatus Uhrbacteria bacterium]